MINLHLPAKSETLRPTITVIGVGGAGGNAVNNMISAQLEGVNFVVANTDAQALDHSLTERTIQLGAGITKGLGAGANPEVGRASAEEAREEIAAYIEGSNMVFITAGMGGGTGTGAASVIARIAKEQGILTVAVVTKPFQFEGTHRMRMAENGLKELQDYVDTLIIIPNQNLFRIANERTTFADAFKMADEVLHSGVRGVTDLMVKPGLINLDFADIRTVMREMGKAMMGTGEATGERRAVEAAEAAISNPLLDDVSLKGARALLISITGGNDMTLFEVDEAANRVREEVDPEANIIFGSTFSDAMEGRMRVSVVATGIDAQSQAGSTPKAAPATEPKKAPYAFGATIKAEPAKPIARVSYDPARDTAATARAVEQRAGGAVRSERAPEPQQPAFAASPEPEEQTYQELVRPAMREPAAAASEEYPEEQELRAEASIARQSAPAGRSFFQRMGRALSALHEEDLQVQTAEPRVQVVQKAAPQAEVSVKPQPQRLPNEDQYLDIPAFLRRQAN
ncbi:MAG: cell division protein FtsZ [Pseudomonadota bacterium]|nr:cell division protein FtsZ [Pseudomonadota bacterium]